MNIKWRRGLYGRAGWSALALSLAACDADDAGYESLNLTEQALTAGSPLIGVPSHRCLDADGNNSTPGTVLQLWDCNGGPNQAFSFTAAGELRTFGNTRCVEAQNAQPSTGARAVINNCTGQTTQQWRLRSDGTISSADSVYCLDATGGGTANRTAVILWPCGGQQNQKWSTTVDTQPPTPPSQPAVSNVTCNAATLSWSASTDNLGVTFYDVYHDGQLMKSVSGSTLSTSITTVPGVSWGLYVNARDAAGNVSQASATLPLKVPPCSTDTQPPTAPSNLTGSASGTTVNLRWTAASDNVAVSAYDVYRNGTKVGSVAGTSTSAPPTSFTDSGLAGNTTYTYTVQARDAQANVSPSSNTLSVTTAAVCSSGVCSVVQLTTDTDIPWGLLTLPDGTILYGRRDAHDLVQLNPTTGQKTTVGTVPNVDETDGEGGLLGIAIGPSFANDHWLYIMHTSASDNRIVRIQLNGSALALGTEQVLLSGLLRNKYHNGGRLRFGPDGKLYASAGDAQNGDNAQNTGILAGKVLRINPDGSIPSDNPFGNAVWSYGHRNPQGLAFDSQGRLWEQEFGNSLMDETNLIQRGGNYGWPNCEGTSSQAGTGCTTPGYIAPKQTYPVAEGSCSGIAIVRDVLYVACERGARLYREVISGSSLTNLQQFFVGTYGRLRTVEPTPDGDLWLTTSNNGDKDSIANNSDEKIFRVLLSR
ncbi:MAG: glucose dehydrogenase [Myxococcaceae bacterium]|nr:glucose dehydrogenase [Myxococcaceae bacterium]